MITPEKLIPRFSLLELPTPTGICGIVVNYVINDLGYLSEWEEKILVNSIYNPALNCTNYYLSNKVAQCMITVLNNNNDFEGLVEHLNEVPYESVLRLKAYGLIK